MLAAILQEKGVVPQNVKEEDGKKIDLLEEKLLMNIGRVKLSESIMKEEYDALTNAMGSDGKSLLNLKHSESEWMKFRLNEHAQFHKEREEHEASTKEYLMDGVETFYTHKQKIQIYHRPGSKIDHKALIEKNVDLKEFPQDLLDKTYAVMNQSDDCDYEPYTKQQIAKRKFE